MSDLNSTTIQHSLQHTTSQGLSMTSQGLSMTSQGLSMTSQNLSTLTSNTVLPHPSSTSIYNNGYHMDLEPWKLGVIVGCSVGGVALVLLGIITFLYCRQRQKWKQAKVILRGSQGPDTVSPRQACPPIVTNEKVTSSRPDENLNSEDDSMYYYTNTGTGNSRTHLCKDNGSSTMPNGAKSSARFESNLPSFVPRLTDPSIKRPNDSRVSANPSARNSIYPPPTANGLVLGKTDQRVSMTTTTSAVNNAGPTDYSIGGKTKDPLEMRKSVSEEYWNSTVDLVFDSALSLHELNGGSLETMPNVSYNTH